MIGVSAQAKEVGSEGRQYRVGIVALSDPSYGGTYQYTLSMIDALRSNPAFHCTLYTTTENRHYDVLGIGIERLPGKARAFLHFLRSGLLGRPGDGMFRGADVLIAPIYTTRLLCARQPFIFTLHDLQERYFPENFSLLQRVWRELSNRLLTRSATRIICESRNVREDICKFLNVRPDRVVVLPAPPVSAFGEIVVSDRLKHRVKASLMLGDRFIFYPAQFFPHKNHIRLVQAFSQALERFPDCQLVLTGQKKYEYERVMSCVARLNIDKCVRHLGYIDTETLAAVYKLATCVFIPTLFESISIPMYESFVLGVPVCASNVVALPEQMGDAGVLFDPLSVADMAEKICQILSDSELRQSLVERGRKRIAQLSSANYTGKLQDLLVEVIERSRILDAQASKVGAAGRGI